MPLTPLARSEMLKALIGDTLGGIPITHASLHDNDPSTSGANEITGGSYARQAISFSAVGTDGIVETDADVVWPVPASKTIKYVGLWSASTSGTFLGSLAVTPNEVFAGAGSFKLNSGSTFTLS